ncbi:unannotated protein [freshwater metagenome]|uniref:Unannotated protein n=1 Tax=freshwater metagenome TaxID=449393 RepID=A0A6J7Q703_9ZZZZ
MPHRRPDRRPGGIDTGDQQQRAHPHHHVDAGGLTVVLGLQQLGDEVVLRLGLAFSDRALHVGDHAHDPATAALLVVGELEDVANPTGECAGHLLGYAEDVADHPHRNLLRVLRCRIALATGQHIVHQAATQRPGVHLVLGNAGRAHSGQHQSARPRVQRSVGADRRNSGCEQRSRCRRTGHGRIHQRHHADAIPRWELHDIVGDGIHILVTRRQP